MELEDRDRQAKQLRPLLNLAVVVVVVQQTHLLQR